MWPSSPGATPSLARASSGVRRAARLAITAAASTERPAGVELSADRNGRAHRVSERRRSPKAVPKLISEPTECIGGEGDDIVRFRAGRHQPERPPQQPDVPSSRTAGTTPKNSPIAQSIAGVATPRNGRGLTARSRRHPWPRNSGRRSRAPRPSATARPAPSPRRSAPEGCPPPWRTAAVAEHAPHRGGRAQSSHDAGRLHQRRCRARARRLTREGGECDHRRGWPSD